MQGNQYHRFGYQPFQEPAQPSYEQQAMGFDDKTSQPLSGLASLVSSPLVMTGALIVSAAVFAGILMVSYPSSDDIPQPIPIVQAEAVPLKSAPEQVGGMEIANRDTTVFEAIDPLESNDGSGRPVENLLEALPEEEQPMDKDQVLATLGAQEISEEVPDAVEKPAEVKTAEIKAEEPAQTDLAPKVAIPVARPQKVHEPGASPDTIAFVRSVLDKKDEKKVDTVAEAPKLVEAPVKPEMIEPASGSEVPVAAEAKPIAMPSAIGSGTHYVQLVSVPSQSAAQAEWDKIQKSLASILGSAPHRIQEANLGEKGVYYRVQVGPYDEASAKSLCEQVKVQKPGGCLVVR